MTLLNAERATYKYPDWSSSRPGHRLMIIKNQSHQVISAIGTVAFLIAYGPFSYCLFDNPFTGCKWSLLAASLIHWPEDLSSGSCQPLYTRPSPYEEVKLTLHALMPPIFLSLLGVEIHIGRLPLLRNKQCKEAPSHQRHFSQDISNHPFSFFQH